MKISQKKNKKKLIIISAIIILFLAVGYIWYSRHYQIWPFLPKEVKGVELNDSDATNNQTKTKANDSIKGVDGTKNSSEIPVSNTTSIEITELSQVGQLINYSATINNSSSNGICSASFTKEGSLPVKKDDTISGNKCGPFSISANTFDSIGEWTLTLRYFADNAQAVTTSKIEVK